MSQGGRAAAQVLLDWSRDKSTSSSMIEEQDHLCDNYIYGSKLEYLYTEKKLWIIKLRRRSSSKTSMPEWIYVTKYI